jgi:hypothetical protein
MSSFLSQFRSCWLFCIFIGGNRGIGLALAQEIKKYAKKTIITSRLPKKITGVDVVSGIDVQDNNCGTLLANALNGTKIDILINNAGYFFGPVETIKSLNFNEEIKMIDICAIGPLRITSGLFNAGLLALGAKVNHILFSFVGLSNLFEIGCDDIISRRQRCLEKSSESTWSRLWPSYV